MCLVAIAWAAHPRYPLVLAGNRDEFHDRPSAPAAWWPEAQQIFGGRDLAAGGSWLGVSRDGRLAVVTNHPGRPPAPERTASRGHLVRDFLMGASEPEMFLEGVQQSQFRYAGFCLIVGSPDGLHGAVSPAGGHAVRWKVARGVSAISNSRLDAPWPKAGYLEARLEDLLQQPAIREEDLFGHLARRQPVSDAPTPESAREMIRRTPFVVGTDYGTRASTVILVDNNGLCRFTERCFDPGGRMTGESRAEFRLEQQLRR